MALEIREKSISNYNVLFFLFYFIYLFIYLFIYFFFFDKVNPEASVRRITLFISTLPCITISFDIKRLHRLETPNLKFRLQFPEMSLNVSLNVFHS